MSIQRCRAAALGAALSFLVVFPAAVEAQDRTATQAPARPVGPGGLVVGTIDFVKALDAYPRKVKEFERLQKLADSSAEQIDKITRRIEEIKGTIQVLADDSRDRDIKQVELELAMQERQAFAKLLREQFDVEEIRVRAALWADLDAAVERLARDRGVHLILRADSVPAPERGKPRDLRNQMVAYEQRQVWFAAKELDLTADLIKLLQVWPLEQPEAGARPEQPGGPPAVPNGEPKPVGGGN